MKKIILLLFLLTQINAAFNANSWNYYAGIIAGINYADMDMVTMRINQQVDSRTLFGVGGVIGLRLNNNISVQVQPMYLRKGGEANILEDQNLAMTMQFNSVEIPLLLKVGFGNSLQPYIITGASFGIITTSESKISFGVFDFDIDNITRDFEVSLVWGAGVDYHFGGGSVFIEGMYTVGLTNLNKGGNLNYRYAGETVLDVEIDSSDKFMNKGFRIMAGFVFPLDD